MEGYIGEISLQNRLLIPKKDKRLKATSHINGDLPIHCRAIILLKHMHPKSFPCLGKSTLISGTNTVITAAWGKSGTETTPDYATNDPVWSNGYEAC